MASDKSSLVQIAQAVLDQNLQAIKIVNADPGTGGATEATALDILAEVESIDAKTPALDAGNVPVDVKASVLPTGAATEATLLDIDMVATETAANTLASSSSLLSIDTKTPALVTGRVPVDVGASVLPTGAATLAEQQTQSTSLSNIDTSLNDIEAVIEVVGHGSPATAQRVAAEVGSNGAVNSSANPLYVSQSAGPWPVRLQDGAGNPIDSQSGALSVQLESLNANEIPGNYGTPTNGSPRVAAMLGVGSTAVSTSNPVPNYATNNLLGVARHDAVVPTFGATTDTYLFKTGGIAGTTVSTVVIEYTDSTKAVIQSVVRT